MNKITIEEIDGEIVFNKKDVTNRFMYEAYLSLRYVIEKESKRPIDQIHALWCDHKDQE